ncbi:MAG: AzlD domain-containing protein [Oscillospiraceae bacterium]
MTLTPFETFITIIAVALGAVITRFLPFIMFPDKKAAPPAITYLGKILPPAMMGLLVVYCLRNVSLISAPHGIPELIAIIVIIILHEYKHNVLLSIGGGTITYMLIIQYVLPLF